MIQISPFRRRNISKVNVRQKKNRRSKSKRMDGGWCMVCKVEMKNIMIIAHFGIEGSLFITYNTGRGCGLHAQHMHLMTEPKWINSKFAWIA